jgi:hypothetical protein
MRALIVLCLALPASAGIWAAPDAALGAGMQASGEIRECLSRRHIAEIRILDDRQLLFRTRLHTYYVNRLPRACTALSPTASLRLVSGTAALCAIDVVTIIESIHGTNGPACALGRFERVQLEGLSADAGQSNFGVHGRR